MTLPSTTFTVFFTHFRFSLPQFDTEQMFPIGLKSIKLALITKVNSPLSTQHVPQHRCWFFPLMRDSQQSVFSFRLLLNMLRQSLTLFLYLEQFQLQCWTDSPLRFSELSCICLMWTTNRFGGLEWISVIVNQQYSRNHRFGRPTSRAVAERVITLVFIISCRRISVTFERPAILQSKFEEFCQLNRVCHINDHEVPD